ncbi:MAG: DUF2029 domain-containing protein [Candidatus Brocadiae bacterium]|nr:DUF2029 domain-containing protein [Candidatus Brocadiia bacterium]
MNLKGFCRIWANRGRRWVLWVVLALAALFVVVSGTERVLRGSSEFMGFRRIVQVSLIDDDNHYERIGHLRAYPPVFPIFWGTFGFFPVGAVPDPDHPLVGTTLSQQIQLGVSAAVLLLIMTTTTALVVFSVMHTVYSRRQGESASCAPVLLWILSGGLMLNGIVRCETDIFIVGMVVAAMHLMLVGDRQWAGGALLGVAAALKLTPGLFGVYLLCRRKYRAVGGMIIAGLVCTAVVPTLVWGLEGSVDRHRSWVIRVLIPYAREGPESFISRPYRRANQSPKAALVRYLTHYNAGKSGRPRYVNVADLPMATVRKIAMALKLIILGLLVVAWALPPRATTRELEIFLFALVPLGMLLLSDVSHGSHLSLLVVPFSALVAFCFRRPGQVLAGRVSWATLAGFLLVHLIAVRQLKEMSVATAGLLTLYGLLLYLSFRLYADARQRAEPKPA